MQTIFSFALWIATSLYAASPTVDEEKQIQDLESELSKVCVAYVQLQTIELELKKVPKEYGAELKKRAKEFKRDYQQARRRYFQIHNRNFVPKECEKLHQ